MKDERLCAELECIERWIAGLYGCIELLQNANRNAILEASDKITEELRQLRLELQSLQKSL